MTSIIVAIITGISVATPTIISTVVNNNVRYKVLEEQLKYTNLQIEDLSKQVAKQNNLLERVALLEHDTQTAFMRIDEIRNNVKEFSAKYDRDLEALR